MIVEGGQKYSVKLIPQTCNREDAIKEIIEALDQLNTISDEIFSTIKNRLQSHRSQVETLSTRVATASQQISNLRGSQRAIRIISPAKYPCDPLDPSKDSLIGQMSYPALVAKRVPNIENNGEREEDLQRSQRPLRFDSSIKHPNDLLSIFHVREPKLGDLNQLDNVTDVGLGKPPLTIKNMDSFFLFNTIDNPYTNYKMTERSQQDRNFGTMKPTRKGEEVHGEVCPAIPSEGDASENKPALDDFYYYPSAVEIPNIDVPESLPDLPGIADTFDDLSSLMEPFSPTTMMFPSKPFSPQLQPPASTSTNTNQNQIPKQEISVRESTPSVAVARNIAVNNVPTPPVAPPPPPPPPVQTAPVPPPPPPITAIPPGATEVGGSGGGDLRSSLMAAIREAGGSGNARLKSVKEQKYEAKKKKQDEKEKNISNELQEGGDLMADLKNTLAMRRRGISGIQDGPKRAAPVAAGGVGDIMLSLAATIPAMENSLEADNSGTVPGSDDDDWD